MQTANDIAHVAIDRIETCNIYINRRALVSHNWVVVSNVWNGRGAFQTTVDGVLHDAIGPFPKGMPTCYTERDADLLVAALNEHLQSTGSTERVHKVLSRTWWTTERDAAQAVLDMLPAE